MGFISNGKPGSQCKDLRAGAMCSVPWFGSGAWHQGLVLAVAVW